MGKQLLGGDGAVSGGRAPAPRRSGAGARLAATSVVLLLLAASLAYAQFGVGTGQQWTAFDDPQGRFSLRVPPDWTFQADQSSDSVFVFYGPGNYDVFYLQFIHPATPSGTLAAEAAANLDLLRGPSGVPGFQLVSAPGAGVLAGKEASFFVYSFTAEGVNLVEGRGLVPFEDQILVLAFSDKASRFNGQVATFNAVMESLSLQETARSAQSGFGFGVGAGGQQGASAAAGTVPTLPVTSPSAPPTFPTAPGAAGTTYTSPGGYYRFTVPQGWELWEEQSTARGDAIEPYHGVVPFGPRSTVKSLFLWDYFDEWTQRGSQYEILMVVFDNVPVTLQEALEAVKDNVMGEYAFVYTVSTNRTRIGGQAGVAADIVVRPNYTEPWTMFDQWYKTVTFYALKPASTLFLWVIPKEIENHPDVAAAMESFQWLGR